MFNIILCTGCEHCFKPSTKLFGLFGESTAWCRVIGRMAGYDWKNPGNDITCEDMRNNGPCGPDAKLFVSKMEEA